MINRQKSIFHGRIRKESYSKKLRRGSRLLNRQEQSQSCMRNQEKDTCHYIPSSALDKHVKKTGHTIDVAHAQTLTEDNTPYHLRSKESLQIPSKRPILNGTGTSVPLYAFPEG